VIGRAAPALAIIGGLAVWQIAAMMADRPWLPPLSSVTATLALMAEEGDLGRAIAASLLSLVIGYPAAAAAGIAVGALMGRSYIVRHSMDIYFDAAMAAPTLIYVPVLFALFGVSRASQVAVVFAYAFFVVAAMTEAGIRGVDQRLVDMSRAFGASERQVFQRIALPAALPSVLTGLRLGAARAVKGMVVGEMVIALSGLGARLKASGGRFDMTGVLAVLLVVLAISLSVNASMRALETRLLRHRRA
jgi:NitT/TauT family transport system permease protein